MKALALAGAALAAALAVGAVAAACAWPLKLPLLLVRERGRSPGEHRGPGGCGQNRGYKKFCKYSGRNRGRSRLDTPAAST